MTVNHHKKPAFIHQPFIRSIAYNAVGNRLMEVRICKGGVQMREIGKEWMPLVSWLQISAFSENEMAWKSVESEKGKLSHVRIKR